MPVVRFGSGIATGLAPPVIGRITPWTTSGESRGTRTGWPAETTPERETAATTAITIRIGVMAAVYTARKVEERSGSAGALRTLGRGSPRGA